jgi:SAM-dependent methyltransferase
MSGPTVDFWQERFATRQTGWDRGAPGPQLVQWLDSGALQACRIVVPGCGAGWEVAELARRGFEVTALDYADAAVHKTQALLHQQGLRAEVLQADVLQFDPGGQFDAVYGQTCLCALHPDHWSAYAHNLHRWLAPGAKLWGLFMQMVRPAATEEGRIQGPPYHCDINAVRALFTGRDWVWPAPPYIKVPHPQLSHELALVLTRR